MGPNILYIIREYAITNTKPICDEFNKSICHRYEGAFESGGIVINFKTGRCPAVYNFRRLENQYTTTFIWNKGNTTSYYVPKNYI